MTEKRFEHRGFMLDVCRHYMPPDEIRTLLRAAALLGLNRMHWHLTDDQGWRLEIRKYPELTEKGSVRGDSFFGGTPAGERNSGFYTQAEVREMVDYARGLGIGIIPEIEIPGHAAALLAACPRFGCRRGGTGERWRDRVEIGGGIFPSLVCAGSDETLAFLRDVLDEVTELFPFPAVHIGGDEALKLRWRRCPDCRRRMRELGLGSENELQRWLVLQMGEYLAEKGRRTIVWNDVLAGGPLPGHFIVQQWLGGEEATRAFMESGGSVIRSDTGSFYLDYAYGRIDVRKIWETPRIPAYARGLEDRLLGTECPLWTERICSLERAAYQLFPRLTAVSLRMDGEDGVPWEAFLEEVKAAEERLERETGLRGAPPSLWHLTAEEAAADIAQEEGRIRSEESLPYVLASEQLAALDGEERDRLAAGEPRDEALRPGDAVLARLYGARRLPEGPGSAAVRNRTTEKHPKH